MNKSKNQSVSVGFSGILAVCLLIGGLLKTGEAGAQTFATGKNEFLLNGKPFVIRAAELHYPRIPKAYWEHRIQLCKAMGMNTICIYLFWNLHEQQEGVYNFTGQNDVAEFIKLVQKNGMYCIVRPGPYVCAEWDMGGLPWWLLRKKDIQVRTLSDSLFMQSSRRFISKAGSLLAPLQIQNGGNIIMVQVENEYGVWGNDEKYMTAIRDNIRAAGFDKVQLFRCDWSSNFDRYNLPGVASTLNFGAGSDIEKQFQKFRQLNPEAPLMCSEYWTGWFDQWGRPHETRGVNTFIGSLKDMMDRRISFSLYMAHGGTSFGQWSGANAPPYAPTVSSYDYDAPIDESGHPTEKFYAIRELLKNYLNEGEALGEIPKEPIALVAVPAIKFTQAAPLFQNLPKTVVSETIQPMEMFGQGWGDILYRTQLPASARAGKLQITDVHDWAAVYIDGKFTGKIDRRLHGNTVNIPALPKGAQLDILIATTGRVNYGRAIIDRKGITEKVVLQQEEKTTELRNWKVYNLPVEYPVKNKLKYSAAKVNGPAWYRAVFNLSKIGDTYLDMSHWGKGMVWVNGRSLGRFWRIGPTQTMFVPGAWLKKTGNEIIVLDVEGAKKLTIAGVTKPIYGINLDESLLHRKPGQQLDLSTATPAITGSLPAGGGWKDIILPQPVQGRYFCFEAMSAQNPNDPITSIAEMEVIGMDGKPVSALGWRVLYADSEDITGAGNTADKVFDMQESVIWQTAREGAKAGHPHALVIDMGASVQVKGFRILPRGDKKETGVVKDYRFYVQEKPFIF
jgi:beta-galactosidase